MFKINCNRFFFFNLIEISSKNIITTKKGNRKRSTTEDKTKTNLTTEVEVGVFIEKLNDVLLQVTNEFESHSPVEEKKRGI